MVGFLVAAIFSGALVLAAYAAPLLVARGEISPSSMLLFSLVGPSLYLGIPFLFCFYAAFFKKFKLLFLSMLLISLMIVLHFTFLVPAERDKRFLEAFSLRLLSEVGLKELNGFFSRIEQDGEVAYRNNPILPLNKIPHSFHVLFASSIPRARVDIVDQQIARVRLVWGGGVYRWGIEYNFTKSNLVGIEKQMEREIGDGIITFISK